MTTSKLSRTRNNLYSIPLPQGTFNMRLSLLIGLIITTLPGHAEVVLDGSVGPATTLPGPNFDIRADYGKAMGNNLFHSFQSFNLNQNESATFSGPAHTENVISRITGGTLSNIDGTMKLSDMPKANFYFINPAGIIFGEHAKLDLPASAHFSTASTLRLQDGGNFSATAPQTSVLTVAPPVAFGFLSDSPASITINGSTLALTGGQTLSLLGGPLQLQPHSQLNVSEGRLNLASLATKGEVTPTGTDLQVTAAARGDLTLREAQMDVSGNGSGSIYIRAGRFELQSSEVLGITRDKDGGGLNIAVTELALLDSSRISASTDGAGNGGNLNLKVAQTTTLAGTSSPESLDGIFSNAREGSTGNAGKIQITTQQLNLLGGKQIGSNTFGSGEGGTIEINVAGDLNITKSRISTSSVSTEKLAGQGGTISIQAQNLRLTEGGLIDSNTYGEGQGGSVIIQVVGNVTLDGYMVIDETAFSSFIGSTTEGAGNAGTIELTAHSLNVNRGAGIGSVTFGAGHGGQIILKAIDQVNVSGSETINGEKLNSEISAGAVAGYSDELGNAGQVTIQTRSLTLSEGGAVTTSADGGKEGGNLMIKADYLLYLMDGKMTTEVKGGQGNGGNITIEKPVFMVLNQSRIKADAHGGNGGNITIDSNQYLRSTESRVTASSKLGKPGEIKISAIDTNVAGSLVILAGKLLIVPPLLNNTCQADLENRSSFMVTDRDGIGNASEDLQPSGFPRIVKGTIQNPKSVKTPSRQDTLQCVSTGRSLRK
jgi:filamentous hemagglutinin family protein